MGIYFKFLALKASKKGNLVLELKLNSNRLIAHTLMKTGELSREQRTRN